MISVRLSFLTALALSAPSLVGQRRDWAIDSIDLKLPPAAKERCHVVRFPRRWKLPRADTPQEFEGFNYYPTDYEFRVEGLLGTTFLVGAFTPVTSHLRYDATNRYRVNLSDPTTTVQPASRADWDNAAVVPLYRKSVLPIVFGTGPQPDHAKFNGFQFERTGTLWTGDSGSRLSPDSSWLVLQSTASRKVRFPWVDYLVFYDVFNAVTGRKLFTIQGKYSGVGDDPWTCLLKTAWLTERYFIIPLGKHRERCVVCEFVARSESGGKP
jgi:hypothetical protein